MNVIELIPCMSGTRFNIKMEYNYRFIAIIKNIEGRLYDSSTKQWSLPNQAYTEFMNCFDKLYENSPATKPKINELPKENLEPEVHNIVIFRDETDKFLNTFSVKVEPNNYKVSQIIKNLDGFLRNYDSARNCFVFQFNDFSGVVEKLDERLKIEPFIKLNINQ